MRRKLLAMILSLTMVFSVAVPAMAADEMAGKVVIIHTNDVHGAGTTAEGVMGYGSVAALKAEYEAKGADVILADAGDFIQGKTLVSVSKGETAIKFMNAAGYDIATLGNHEFDYGYANLAKILKGAEFDVVAANVTYNGENVFGTNKVITTDGGVKVGIFGVITPEAKTKSHPAKTEGVEFLAGSELFACAQAQVDELEAAGCDIIVCLGHLGVSDESAGNRSTDLLAAVKGIDLFIDGHSHTVMAEKVGDTVITSTGTALANIGVVTYDKATGAIEATHVTGYTGVDADVDADVNAVAAEIQAEYGATFATTEVLLDGNRAPGVRTQETNLGDLITDALLWKANELGVEVDCALTNGGGIRATINAGDITKNDINTVLPFGNTLCMVELTGAELLEALEASTFSTPDAIGAFPQVAGIKFTVNTNGEWAPGEQYAGSTYYAPAAAGTRVTIESVNGKAFDPAARYTVATNDFLAAGGDTYFVFSASPFIYDLGIPMDEVVMEYITTVLGGVVTEAEYGVGDGEITVVAGEVVKAPTTEAPVEEVPVEEVPAATDTYTVVAGDTLCKIAKALYGSTYEWRKIYEANKAIIADPNLIYVGQVLAV